jgi:hypothetical protein
VSVLVTACGGGSSLHVASIAATTSTSTSHSTGASGASAPYANAVNFARCMRAHGQSNFPDPHNPGGFSGAALARLDTRSRSYVRANGTCQRLLPNNGQPAPAEVAQVVTDGLKFARCMRAHGVQFPDPGVSGDHITIDLGQVETNSPQYTTTAETCRTKPGA